MEWSFNFAGAVAGLPANPDENRPHAQPSFVDAVVKRRADLADAGADTESLAAFDKALKFIGTLVADNDDVTVSAHGQFGLPDAPDETCVIDFKTHARPPSEPRVARG
jgi:hypothetical protein